MKAHAFRFCRGFTLTELLTVVAIVGILAAIIIPVVGRARSVARQSQCATQLRQIHVAVVMNAQENKGILVRGHDYDTNTHWYQKGAQLASYVGNGMSLQQISVCPEGRTDNTLPAQDEFGQWVQNGYGYPYSCNYYVLTNQAGSGGKGNTAVVRLNSIRAPGQVVMLTDSNKGADWGALGFASASDSKWARIGTPHGGKTKVLWCDGHVTLTTKADIEDNVSLQ